MHTGMRERATERANERWGKRSGDRGKTQIAVYRDKQEMNTEREREKGSVCMYICGSQRDEKGKRERDR